MCATNSNLYPSRDLINAILNGYQATALGRQPETQSVISTGYTDYDIALGGGFEIGALHIISGAEGSGKTTLLANITKRMLGAGVQVLYVSSEQTLHTVMGKIIQTALDFPVSSVDIFSGNIPDFQTGKMANALKFFAAHDLTVACYHTYKEIRDAVEKIKPQVLIVDSIQGMMDEQPTTDIYQETARNVKSLNALAIRMNIIVIAVSHANREGRKNTSPLNNYNLSNSGSLEYLSASISFVRQTSKTIPLTQTDPKSRETIPHRVYGQLLEIRVSKDRLRMKSDDQTFHLLWLLGLTSIKDDPRTISAPEGTDDSTLRARCQALVDAYKQLGDGRPIDDAGKRTKE